MAAADRDAAVSWRAFQNLARTPLFSTSFLKKGSSRHPPYRCARFGNHLVSAELSQDAFRIGRNPEAWRARLPAGFGGRAGRAQGRARGGRSASARHDFQFPSGHQPRSARGLPEGSHFRWLFAHAANPAVRERGVFRHLPLSYGAFVKHLDERATFDAGIVHVSSPDKDGPCSIGPRWSSRRSPRDAPDGCLLW
jgi:hypothetical protein